MKASAIIIMAVLALAACTTTGEGSRKSVAEAEESQDNRANVGGIRVKRQPQQARLQQPRDDGIRVRKARPTELAWEPTVETRLFESGDASGLTAADVNELKKSLAFALTTSTEGASYRWKFTGVPASGEVRFVTFFVDEDGRECRVIRNVFEVGGTRKGTNLTACRPQNGEWEVTDMRSRRKGDDFSDRSAKRKN